MMCDDGVLIMTIGVDAVVTTTTYIGGIGTTTAIIIVAMSKMGTNHIFDHEYP